MLMIWWIALVVVVLSLVLLVLVASTVLRRLPVLRRALSATRVRAADAEALRVRAAELQERLAELGGRAEVVQRRAAEIKNSGAR